MFGLTKKTVVLY